MVLTAVGLFLIRNYLHEYTVLRYLPGVGTAIYTYIWRLVWFPNGPYVNG